MNGLSPGPAEPTSPGLPDGLDRLLAAQERLVRRDQLAAIGVSRAARRRRLDRGMWRELLPGVYLAGPQPATPWQRLVAAFLYAGDGAQLTGIEALRLHGFDHLPDEGRVRLLVPHGRQVRPAGPVRLCRTRRPDPQPVPFGPVHVCRVGRAVADTARWSGSTDLVRRIVAQAIDRGLTTTAELTDELEHGPRQHRRPLRHALTGTADTGQERARPPSRRDGDR